MTDTKRGDGDVHNKEVVTGSATYEGEIKDGLKHGMGTLTWDDGDQYVGEFYNDQKTAGTFHWKGGDTYSGEWKNSLMHGKGTYTYRNLRRYEGEWYAGYKQGHGVFSWPNGDIYVGEFFKDMCNGVGIQSWSDGRIYKGQWSQNKKHGFGTLKLANGEKIQGKWNNNRLTDKAIHTEANGDRYEEIYQAGISEGRKKLKRNGGEMDRLLAATTPPPWIPDSQAKSCYACGSVFSILNRRHHCRHCGQIFCNDCTTHRIAIERLGLNDNTNRVCEECYLAIVTDVHVKIPPNLEDQFKL